jgi:hypothetical protein
MCTCVKITFIVHGESTPTTIEVNVSGIYNSQNYYAWNHAGIDYYLYYGLGEWQVSYGGLGFPAFPVATAWKESKPPCPPLGSVPQWNSGMFDKFTTEECQTVYGDCCIEIDVCWTESKEIQCNILQTTNQGNGTYTVELFGETYTIYFDGTVWSLVDSNSIQYAYIPEEFSGSCPAFRSWTITSEPLFSLTSSEVDCQLCGKEERIFREYDSIKLPENFEEPNRGLKGCCECEYLVFASGSSSTFENDVTSAWMKLSSSSDIITFVLEDANGNPANFIPTPQPFIKEPNAFFTTINWKDVLTSDGQGCYTLKIQYEISGIVGFVIWGHYKLQNYSIQNTLKTARVRAFFNAFHEMEGINFTDSNVESTFRFYGFIGNRQPNTEIDNIIYQNREMKRVIRENLNQYEIITDPVFECFTRPLIELFLLSENDLFISDYNQHNHSYRIQDIPVILEESASLDYLPLSRYAVLKCKVGDKFKNKRTYF